MANTLTAILPTIYEAADQVARELTGFIPAVYLNAAATRAAKGQTITYPIVGSMAAADITPGNIAPAGADQTINAGSMTISKSRKVSFNWTGEESRSLSVGDVPQGQNILRDQFTQSMRTLVNEIESDLWTAAYQGASRATGTAGTAPFGTANDLSDFAAVLRVLEDDGAPAGNRRLVVGAAAMANLRGKQAVLFRVNEAGTADLLRRGVIGEVMGLMIGNSFPIASVTKGTGAAYTSTAAGFPVGTTSIPLITGTGTVLAGDRVTFAGDSNIYVVTTGVAAPGTIVIGAPGLRQAIPTSATAMTIGNNATTNIGFDRNALHLLSRAPAMPAQGDQADDVIEIVDPQTGLAFQVALYRQYRQISYEVGMAWGTKAVKNDFITVLLG